MTPEQLVILRTLAKNHKFGRGPGHANKVNTLSLKIHNGLVMLGLLQKAKQDEKALEAAALLHDVGWPKEPHNEVAFDCLSGEIPGLLATDPLPPEELSTILYCVLWHRGTTFTKRGIVDIADASHTKKLAAILRVADALDRTLQQLVEDVSVHKEGPRLIYTLSSKYSVKTEIDRANEKSDLMKQAYALTEVSFEQAKQ